jgi:AcrR family transcriptional regulator
MAKTEAAALPNRKERARATRRRIVEGAYRVFCSRGYLNTTMEAIAAEAGVAVQTVYFTFHTKIEVLFEAFDAAVLGPTETPPDRREWFARLGAEPDPIRSIELLVENVGEILQRVAPLAAVFQTLGSIPEATERFHQRENLRRESFARIAKSLSTKGAFRPGMKPSMAADVLFVLLGPLVYQAMSAECGWSHSTWKRWARETLSLEFYGAVSTSRPNKVR